MIPCDHCKDPGCRLCHLYATRPDYRAMWDGQVLPPVRKAEPCIHLGEPTGETVECPACGRNPDGKAKVRIKLMFCAIHGDCTVGKKADGVHCCEGCQDNPAYK